MSKKLLIALPGRLLRPGVVAWGLLIALIHLGLGSSPVMAGRIDAAGVSITRGDVTDFSFDEFGAPPVEPDDNTDFAFGFFAISMTITSESSVDILIPVTPSGSLDGAHEHDNSFFLTNETGEEWSSVAFELGTTDPFVRGGIDDLDFDTPDRDSFFLSDGFPPTTHEPALLVWEFLGTATNPVSFDLTLDVPQINDPFVLRITPNFGVSDPIPEPSTASVLALSVVLLSARRRQRFANQ